MCPVVASSREAGLHDRVIVVTGGAQGLGRAYSRRLLAGGGKVLIIDQARAALDHAVAELAAAHGSGRILGRAVDVRDEAAVANAVTEAVGSWGRVDCLVNNAGGSLVPARPMGDFSRHEWSLVLEINLTAAWLCSKEVVPYMRSAGYGKIVNISSATVSRGQPVGMAPYVAAKAGVIGLTRALARELGEYGIRVNAIAPGYVPVETQKAVRTPEAAESLRRRILAEQSIHATLTPDDLAGAVEFLCASASDSITGQVLNVDGGWAFS